MKIFKHIIYLLLFCCFSSGIYSQTITDMIPDFRKEGIWLQFQYGVNLSDRQSREIMLQFKAYDRTKTQLERSRKFVQGLLLKEFVSETPNNNRINSLKKTIYKLENQLSENNLDFFFALKESLNKKQLETFLSYSFDYQVEPVVVNNYGHKRSIKY